METRPCTIDNLILLRYGTEFSEWSVDKEGQPERPIKRDSVTYELVEYRCLGENCRSAYFRTWTDALAHLAEQRGQR